jgi:hypothetical protein
MVNWGVVAAALVGLVVYPFVAIALHELFAGTEKRTSGERGSPDPPSVNQTYQSRTIPGGSRRRED